MPLPRLPTGRRPTTSPDSPAPPPPPAPVLRPVLRLVLGLILGLVLLVTVGGCGLSSDTGSTEPRAADATSSASTASPSPSSSPSATPSDATSTAGASDGADGADGADGGGLGDPVTTRTSDDDGFSLRLTVYPVRRDGDLAVLNFTVRVDSAQRPGSHWQVAQTLSDGDYRASDFSGDTVDGVKLTDSAHRLLHLVASDGRGSCLCSRGLSSTFIDPGATKTFDATYAAPPAGVDEVTLSFPLFGTVTGVPVE
jgi:hypothetical protein